MARRTGRNASIAVASIGGLLTLHRHHGDGKRAVQLVLPHNGDRLPPLGLDGRAGNRPVETPDLGRGEIAVEPVSAGA